MIKTSLFTLLFFGVVLINAYSQGLPRDAPQSGYLIGPGDEITGKVLGEPQYDFVSTVDEDGRIEVPFFETTIIAKCRTERELRADVNTLLAKYLRNPQISLRVTERKSRPPATIYGEVRTPQQITLMRKARLVEVLAFSGGVTDDAGGVVQVFRTQPPICDKGDTDDDWRKDSTNAIEVPSRQFSLSAVRSGRDDSNPVIYPGDVIVVEKALPVYITGEVVTPQGVYIKEGGISLTEAIAKIGGVKREAKTKDIKIYRLKSGSKDREIIAANYDLIKKGEQKDVMLQPYDIVEVDKAKEGIAMTILKIAVGAGRTAVSGASSAVGTRILY